MNRTLLYQSLSICLGVASMVACGPPRDPNDPAFQAFMADHDARQGGSASAGGPSSASAVCDLITMSDIRLQCAQGAASRTYSSEELSTCAGMMMNEQKRDCMLTSGQAAVAPTVAPTVAAPPPEPAPAPAAGPIKVLAFRNFFRLAVTRVVWRPTKEVRFRELPLRRPLATGTSVDLDVGEGNVDFCFEFEDGTRVFSTNMKNAGFFLIPNNEDRQRPGACVDTL